MGRDDRMPGPAKETPMGRSEHYTAQLQPLLADPRHALEVERLLVAHSGLPGPRGNLELAEAFVRSVSTAPMPDAWLATLYGWAGIDAQQAPVGDPREFLAFCAVVAFGAMFHTHACLYPCTAPSDCTYWPLQCRYLVEAIRRAAADSRWRLREAAAMALQHLGGSNPAALRAILTDWLKGPSLMEHRAVLAALAHPPLLRVEGVARFALKAGDTVLKKLAALPPAGRKGEDFRVLVKGLSYALSVFTAALPADGFALLDRWGSSGDPAIRRILVANLSKRRIRTADARRAAALEHALAGQARRPR
jgi:hypothetical protein